MVGIATPALRILAGFIGDSVQAIEVLERTRRLAERVPGEREEAEPHRPFRRAAVADVITVALVADNPPGADEFPLPPLHDLPLDASRDREVLAQRPDQCQQSEVGVVMLGFAA